VGAALKKAPAHTRKGKRKEKKDDFKTRGGDGGKAKRGGDHCFVRKGGGKLDIVNQTMT